MSSFFKGYNEIWSCSNKVMNRYEKDILLTIIGYWKNVTENKHYKWLEQHGLACDQGILHKALRHYVAFVGDSENKYYKRLEQHGLACDQGIIHKALQHQTAVMGKFEDRDFGWME